MSSSIISRAWTSIPTLASCAVSELLYNALHPDKPHLKEITVPSTLINFDRIPCIRTP